MKNKNVFFYKKKCKNYVFSQNFLYNNDIIENIISAINPLPKQTLLEIGPGLGALTLPVIKKSEYLTAIEIDSKIIHSMLTRYPFIKNKIKIIQDNVLNVNITELSKKIGNPIRIFGNLPYHISTPIIFHLFKHIESIYDMHFMLQKEVVERLSAQPNNKIYGRLSVIAQYFCKITPLLNVVASSFIPQPKVNSTLVRMKPYIVSQFPVKDLTKLVTITKLAFNQRRKIISNSLSRLFNPEQLLKYGIYSTLRAENISVEQYCYLANKLYFTKK